MSGSSLILSSAPCEMTFLEYNSVARMRGSVIAVSSIALFSLTASKAALGSICDPSTKNISELFDAALDESFRGTKGCSVDLDD